jgi:integrase
VVVTRLRVRPLVAITRDNYRLLTLSSLFLLIFTWRRAMSVSIEELIARADAVVSGFGYAPSTLSQYRWAWSQVKLICFQEPDVTELTNEVVASFLQFVAAEHLEGRIKEWKRKLLRKAVLVLSEVATTGTYTWSVSRAVHPNDGLDAMLRPVQDQFEEWLAGRDLAVATADLYATISRKVLAWLPQRGVTDVRQLCASDVSAAAVFLGESYRPGSTRTVLSALRVWCRFLEESDRCVGLARAVPVASTRRIRAVSVLSAEEVETLVGSPIPATPAGRRDRALLLVAVRTGLRPVDIAGLRLSDIDWRHGQITVTQHKTGTVVSLPLLADVGAGIADYLLHDRPASGDDHVFLRSQAPHVAIGSSDLYHVSAGALARTKTVRRGPGRGMRVLRASLATRMLEADTPLPVISGALGHRGIASAKHYLATDERRMRQCCLDFTGIEPRAVRS